LGVYELPCKCYLKAFHLVNDKFSFALVMNTCIGNKILFCVCYYCKISYVLFIKYKSRESMWTVHVRPSALLSLSVEAAVNRADIQIDGRTD
jgi:hypothetical protein